MIIMIVMMSMMVVNRTRMVERMIMILVMINIMMMNITLMIKMMMIRMLILMMFQMSLMKRDRHSLTAVPVSAGVAGEVFPSLAEENDSFCKLILASPGDVADRILARERRQLERQMEEERHLPESCFIEEVGE